MFQGGSQYRKTNKEIFYVVAAGKGFLCLITLVLKYSHTGGAFPQEEFFVHQYFTIFI